MQADLVFQEVEIVVEVWVMMRTGCTAALLRKRLSDAFVSVCSKGASAGGLCAAGWRGVPGQQAVPTGVHFAESSFLKMADTRRCSLASQFTHTANRPHL